MIFIWDLHASLSIRIAFVDYMIYTVSARLQSYDQINFDLLNHWNVKFCSC